MQDAKNNHRDYGMEEKFGLGLRHNRTLLGTLYLDMFCVMGALQLITWVLTHGRAGRGSPITAYINTLLRDTGLEKVRDLNCRPRYKYHVKSPKYVPGYSQFLF